MTMLYNYLSLQTKNMTDIFSACWVLFMANKYYLVN